MKKYVWAFISFNDNEMKMGHGRFSSEQAAIIFAMKTNGWECEAEEFDTVQDIKRFAFDCDCMVGAYSI
jgi:hypothetical protein